MGIQQNRWEDLEERVLLMAKHQSPEPVWDSWIKQNLVKTSGQRAEELQKQQSSSRDQINTGMLAYAFGKDPSSDLTVKHQQMHYCWPLTASAPHDYHWAYCDPDTGSKIFSSLDCVYVGASMSRLAQEVKFFSTRVNPNFSKLLVLAKLNLDSKNILSLTSLFQFLSTLPRVFLL